MILVLRCPNCKHDMKYQASSMILAGKRKRCVYCGKTYKISENILRKDNR